jgi:hypothetical protein
VGVRERKKSIYVVNEASPPATNQSMTFHDELERISVSETMDTANALQGLFVSPLMTKKMDDFLLQRTLQERPEGKSLAIHTKL